jgi:hypothetical protein
MCVKQDSSVLYFEHNEMFLEPCVMSRNNDRKAALIEERFLEWQVQLGSASAISDLHL